MMCSKRGFLLISIFHDFIFLISERHTFIATLVESTKCLTSIDLDARTPSSIDHPTHAVMSTPTKANPPSVAPSAVVEDDGVVPMELDGQTPIKSALKSAHVDKENSIPPSASQLNRLPNSDPNPLAKPAPVANSMLSELQASLARQMQALSMQL